MSINFMGLTSVLDRTIFTKNGPIVKKPLPILTGNNATLVSAIDVVVPTANFVTQYEGFTFKLVGTPDGRNDGSFLIYQVLSSTRLRLQGATFNITNVAQTVAQVVVLANDLRSKYNLHRTAPGVHGSNDGTNVVTSPVSVDLTSAITLLNELRVKFGAHVTDVAGSPKIHSDVDLDDVPVAGPAKNIQGAILLANDLRAKFEQHRQLNTVHLTPDFVDKVITARAQVVKGTGPLVGPFTWTIFDPRLGTVADEAADVSVLVNGNPASIDAVFGLLGAIVLTTKPNHGDSVSVDYNYVNNPPAQMLRLNSPEFNLNQNWYNGWSGFPTNQYRGSSYLIGKGLGPDLVSAFEPLRVGWKFKALERAYSAVLNDPNSLLLNVPTNRLTYPVLAEFVSETTIRYDPTSLPQNAIDPWTLEGDGTFALAPGGTELKIVDSDSHPGSKSRPPFFSHSLDIIAPSLVSAAFRNRLEKWESDGCFTGVSFGISDGNHVGLIGFVETNATGLSSAITRINSIKAKFNSHIIQSGVHTPDDTSDAIIIVNASDFPSLVILANLIKTKFNSHLAKGGMAGVHNNVDTTNFVTTPDAKDLDTAVALVNALSSRFNLHRVQPFVHFANDTVNVVGLVKQVGVLTDRGVPEYELSWESYSVDWTVLTSYRISRSPTGDVSVFLSGSVSPVIVVEAANLPAISNLDGRFDLAQQVFFGAVEREAKSDSRWDFIRTTVVPLDSELIGDNKSVLYSPTVVPEKDANNPWFTVGQGGFDRIFLPSGVSTLLLDSTCSTPASNVQELGQTSGAYRGFTRLEPILSGTTSCAFEFTASVDYYTFGLDSRAAGVFLDDDNFSVHLVFLQFSPSSATITGTAPSPFALVNNDSLVFIIQNGNPVTVIFSTGDSITQVITKINTAAGFTFADSSLGRLRLTSQNAGSSATFSILSGSAMVKFGFSPGVYFGLDSNPEPKVSWFGENLPDQDNNKWSPAGSQPAQMLGRILQVTDSSSTDYRTYLEADPIVTNQAFNPSVDWKLDTRLAVLSSIPGDAIPASPPYLPLYFSGALVSIDEGIFGKNIELHLSVDNSGTQYLNLLSYNATTGSLNVQAQYAFSWNDGQIHSFNIYTNKLADLILVLADGSPLTPLMGQSAPTYSALNAGIAGPSISFGSGGEAVTGADLKNAQSLVNWHSVAIFRDSKLASSSAAGNRMIGLFKGGDPNSLSSYYLHQIDWSSSHTYRIIRDPVDAVNVYVDNGYIPVISASYDSLTLPPVSSSFLNGITNGRSSISFGSFNPSEICRTRWRSIKYSVGRITTTERLIPPHQVLNQANAIVSPDHLFTKVPHIHRAFKVYSGGTPTDDFMSNPDVQSFTILGEGTPIVPATQNLGTRGGLKKIVTTLDNVPTTSFVNVEGFLSDFEDDTDNTIVSTSISSLSTAIAVANDIKAKFNKHLVRYRTHVYDDPSNSVLLVDASDPASLVALANAEKAFYNLHRVQNTVHTTNDTVNVVTAPNATDLTTATTLLNNIRIQFNLHRVSPKVHGASVFIRIDAPDGVLYEGMKFYKFPTGEAGHVSPFADSHVVGVMHDILHGVDTPFFFYW